MKKLILFFLVCLIALAMNAQKCAILEFRGSASVSVADVDGISEMFMTYFRPAGYTMIERAQIDKVISEQHFQRSSITDNQAVQLGKILNASVIVLGKVSMLGGDYQVDVRVVNVQYGHDIALEGATFHGDFRTNIRSLAQRLAGQVAIASEGAISVNPEQTLSQRSKVEIVYGYLKVFPNELGTFDSEPITIISQINKQAQHGYNNWRIPTNEELSLLRSNGYLGNGQYMSREIRKGIVLLVSDGDDFVTVQKKEEDIRKAEEARKAALRAQGWVDLGLPSGTLWKDQNEEGGFFTYEQAVMKFGTNLPTKKQLIELKNSCNWTWTGSGYKIEGPSGETITLPAAGYRYSDGSLVDVGSSGYYWSSTPYDSNAAYYLYFFSSKMSINCYRNCYGRSVRLVK